MSFKQLLETAIAYRFACLDRDASKKRFAQPHEAYHDPGHMNLVSAADMARHALVHAVLALDIGVSERVNETMVRAWANGQGIEVGESVLPSDDLV